MTTRNRLERRLASCAATGRKALNTFITAGDPELAATVPALHALVAGGADILELGVPFSDPEAEGPAIQRSSERALSNHVSLDNVLSMAAEFRADDDETPVVLMGYLNSVLRMGYREFAERAAAIGVDGLIVVNLPPEEAGPLKGELDARGISLILLVAPTTTAERAKLIAANASGFIYYVSLKGVTGADHIDPASVSAKVATLRDVSELPILVGFGIKNADSARKIGPTADGIVVGSALVETMAAYADNLPALPEALRAQLAELRAGLDSG